MWSQLQALDGFGADLSFTPSERAHMALGGALLGALIGKFMLGGKSGMTKGAVGGAVLAGVVAPGAYNTLVSKAVPVAQARALLGVKA